MAEQPVEAASGSKAETRAGKYLTFFLGNEEYGLEILKVREIMGMMEITAIPKSPPYIKGVVNIRGKVIPVVDLRLKFSLEPAEATDQTCIIVVDIGDLEMGLIVDRVSEVLDIAEEDIENTPSFGVNVNTDFILGMGKRGENVTTLLDICKVLAESNVDSVTG